RVTGSGYPNERKDGGDEMPPTSHSLLLRVSIGTAVLVHHDVSVPRGHAAEFEIWRRDEPRASNHYHLLIETPEAVCRGFDRRPGHLFQGRFKGILGERDTHARAGPIHHPESGARGIVQP